MITDVQTEFDCLLKKHAQNMYTEALQRFPDRGLWTAGMLFYMEQTEAYYGFCSSSNTQVKSCDCGAAKANTTHTNWCSSNG